MGHLFRNFKGTHKIIILEIISKKCNSIIILKNIQFEYSEIEANGHRKTF